MLHRSVHSSSRSGRRPRPSRGKGRIVASALGQLPDFLRLLYGLLTDSRVSSLDKIFVGAAVAYIVAPVDIVPDFIPMLGEIDELFILVLALRHLIAHTDPDVVMDHWEGDPDALDELNLERILAAAAFLLPSRVRRRLRKNRRR